ncbi:beta strand repeat-containing protein [Symmachiella macrocystis]|uniref:beta strand repeat-containing protein n=1 Tax=Symmachiella macrocystis TaxID=2527985 RepID=UPI0018D43BCB|nr:FG-GAP-like repeat-containing protein [Symmachiella macrocystis]
MLSASSIVIDGEFSDWEAVTSYTDATDDQHDTDHNGQNDTPSYVDHPDVDLLEYKVSHDEENFYFYFEASGEIGATQQENLAEGLRSGRYYVIVTIDVDNDDSTGYWLNEGGYYPTSDGYDMNAELEFYNGAINTGHYLLHGALDDAELEQSFADQSGGNYVWGGPQTQGPFDPGFVEIKAGDYDHYTQWVYKNDDPANGGNDSVTFVQDRGPVVTGNITFAQSADSTKLEMMVPFEGFLTDQFGNSIIELGQTVDLSFSLEASGELSNEVSPTNPNGEWASDTGSPIVGYVLTTPKDYGDAPDSYSTLAASNGASHLGGSGLHLGATVDTEFDGQPDVNASLDTYDDGITAITALIAGDNVTGTVVASSSGFLNGWIDYNQDGDFADDGEQFVVDQAVVAGDNDLNFTIPLAAVTGSTYARLRVSTQAGLSYDGEAVDGEVEDYFITISGAETDLNIEKSSGPTSVAQGEAVTYTLTVTNNGPVDVVGATVADTFNAELENMTWTAVLSAGASGNTSGTGDINELIDLASGSTITYTVSGTVTADAQSFVFNKASVTTPHLVNDTDLTNNNDYDIDVITVNTATSLGEFVEGDIAPGVNDGDFVKEVVFGDLNGDGWDDAVFAFVNGGHQIWFYDENAEILVDSGQALAIEANPAAAHHALGTEIADFNNDGYLDIVVLVKSTQAVYLNDGAGNFGTGIDIVGISSLEAYEVEVGDLDGDGDVDLIVADDDGSSFGGTGNSLLLFNDGSGSFTQITSMPMTTADDDTWDTTVGDFDGDGSLDIVFANFNSGQTSELWLNDGSGTFTKSAQDFGENRHWNVEQGDFDDDGDLDLMLVVNSGDPDYVELWRNDGVGNFSYDSQRTFTNENGQGGIEGIQIGDLDGDGDLDAFFSTYGVNGTIQTWENDGSGTFTTGFVSTFITPTAPDTAGGWRSRLSDVDGDGDLDAFVFEGLNEQVHYFENINNVAPTIAVDSSSITVPEGTAATNTGTFGDTAGDTVSLSASMGTIIDNNNGTWSWSYDTTDGPDESDTVTITATDGDGAAAQTTFALTVDNVAPTVAADNATVSVSGGSTANNSGVYNDVGDDTVTVTASIGTLVDNNNGTWSWSFDTTGEPNGGQTVTITATDSDNVATQTSFSLTINNLPPTVGVDQATVAVNEGGTANNSGTYGDANGDPVTVTASMGTIIDNNDGTWSWSYDTTDGPDDSTVVTITATDDANAAAQTTFSLTVNNLAPTVGADNSSVTVDENDTANNTGTYGDAGNDGIVLSASVGTIVDNNNGTWSWSYDTTDGPDDSTAVTITATDSDGAASETTFALTVNNVAPGVGVNSASVEVIEGNTANNSGSYGDVGNDNVSLSASVGTVVDNNDGTWSWSFDTTSTADSGTVTITATDSDGAESEISFALTVGNAVSEPAVRSEVLTGVTDQWQIVTLDHTYNSLVVVSTVNSQAGDPPVVSRIRNANGNSFEIKLQRTDGSTTAIPGRNVHYIAVEEGSYNETDHGITMEAVKYDSSITDNNSSWAGEQQEYQNSYTAPVVIGQVMTENDSGFSAFWSRGSSRSNVPTPTDFYVGKHVGEDSDRIRNDETLGFIVIESGSGTIDGLNFTAGLGADSVLGIDNSPAYNYNFAISGTPLSAVVSQAGMDGNNGGWAVLYGADPLSANSLGLAIDEDIAKDSERSHTSEQVAYIVFSEPTPVQIGNPEFRTDVLGGVSDQWQTVEVGHTYDSMVVVATVNSKAGDPPVVTRIRNANGNSFEIKLQRTDGSVDPISAMKVHYTVVEEGVYTQANHGITMEAVKFVSTRTDENNSWVGEERSYANNYSAPVVVGQVMSENDAGFSTFWSRGTSRTNAPSANSLYVGKNVGEDPDSTRNDETIGYIVIESGSGTIDGLNYTAGLGADSIAGYGNSPAYNYNVSTDGAPISAVASLAGMDGGNGGWAVLYGETPLSSNESSNTIGLAIDEDVAGDTERSHTTEQVAYLIFSQGPVAVVAAGENVAAGFNPAARNTNPQVTADPSPALLPSSKNGEKSTVYLVDATSESTSLFDVDNAAAEDAARLVGTSLLDLTIDDKFHESIVEMLATAPLKTIGSSDETDYERIFAEIGGLLTDELAAGFTMIRADQSQ